MLVPWQVETSRQGRGHGEAVGFAAAVRREQRMIESLVTKQNDELLEVLISGGIGAGVMKLEKK